MIAVVTLNPAFDVTYEVAEVDWAGVNRPDRVHVKAGGKGVNVARTLRALGSEVLLLGLAEPSFGARLAGSGITIALTAISGETRRTVAVVNGDRRETALFNEPGPSVGEGEYAEFLVHYDKAARDCSMIVLSGSLPGNVAASAYAELIAAAGPVPVILDTSGPALAVGAAAGPALAKPNLVELTELAPATPQPRGYSTSSATTMRLPQVELAARRLGETGILPKGGAVVVSLGARGLVAVEAGRSWHAWPGAPVAGNPTGAGDAVVAGLAHFAELGWPERLRHAVALGTATVLGRTAGEFSFTEYERQLALVRVRS